MNDANPEPSGSEIRIPRASRPLVARLPIVSSVREIGSGPRRFLMFNMLNVVSWQCIAGSVLVLFARRIDMPPSWVGFLISFLPLSMIIVAGTIPLVNYFGSRRLMVVTWTLRNAVACIVFTMPWAIAQWGPKSAWYVLMAATLGFCLMRAIGVGGWFPWIHEIVPEEQRAAYFSAEASITHLINILVILSLGRALKGSPEIGRFLSIYAVGVIAGFASLIYMLRVPGGKDMGEDLSLRGSYAAYRVVFADRPYLRFVTTVSLGFSCASWYSSALVLYLRDSLGYPSSTIMLFIAAGSAGILLTIQSWGKFTEHSGSGLAMSKSMLGHSVVVLMFIALAPGMPWTSAWTLVPSITLASILSAACWTAAHRAMLNFVQERARIAYTNFWTITTAMAMGITPILAGLIIEFGGLWGYRACFAISTLTGLTCAWLFSRVVKDAPSERMMAASPFNITTPVRTLARIFWITIGLHESNR